MMLPPISIDGTRLSRLRDGALMVRTPAAVIEVQGPGALQCLQGLLSNDLVAPGDGGVAYTALLTPKGMITTDMWVLRLSEQRLFLVGDAGSQVATLAVLTRSIPGRLARVYDRSSTHATLWLCGDLAIAALAAAGFSVPDGEGRVVVGNSDETELMVARPHGAAPFRAVLVGSPEVLVTAAQALVQAGVMPGDTTDLEASRILAGWPRLGAEIQERTLPQEVRYDEIQGLSYTKGCYLGQETVARLHFRGHPNRELRGLIWHGLPELASDSVVGSEGHPVGVLGSLLVLPKVTVGLAILRREVHPGAVVSTSGHYARVVPLPFATLASYT